MNKLLRTALKTGLATGLSFTSIWLGLTTTASALPGQSVDEAEAWMQAHPTLRAQPRERLSIRRNDTPSRRYTFHGSVFGPSGSSSGQGLMLQERSGEPIIVRSEKFTLVDIISGVSVHRLEDALRTIYGAEVYADYRRSQSLLVYSPGRLADRGTARAARSQLYEGDLYAYVVEVLPNPDGTIHTGAVSVMVKEDIPEFKTALSNQETRRQAVERPEEPFIRPVEGRARRLLRELNERRITAPVEGSAGRLLRSSTRCRDHTDCSNVE